MANAFKISTAARNAACDAIVDLLDVGGVGSIVFRDGTPPAACADADVGTLLATLTLPATAFGAASVGVATAANITSASAAASGTPTYFRLKNNAATVVAQGTVGTSGCDANFDNTTFVSGGTVAITNGSFTITVPINA